MTICILNKILVDIVEIIICIKGKEIYCTRKEIFKIIPKLRSKNIRERIITKHLQRELKSYGYYFSTNYGIHDRNTYDKPTLISQYSDHLWGKNYSVKRKRSLPCLIRLDCRKFNIQDNNQYPKECQYISIYNNGVTTLEDYSFNFFKYLDKIDSMEKLEYYLNF